MTSSARSTVPRVRLRDGHEIPQLGFGVFRVPPEQTAELVLEALSVGYRLIDTAAMYENEAGVGQAVERSAIPRDELFITTKVWHDDQGPDATRRAFDRSLARLGLDYVDLYLVHWPAPARDRYVKTWRTLVELKADGRARSVGVSNFLVEHLERVIAETGETPVLNQVELHPYLQQERLRRFHAEHGIVTEAWAPLGRGRPLGDPTLGDIARAHGRTPAQVVLRWHIQLGTVAIPKSATPRRVVENFGVFDFELSADEMDAIAALEAGERTGPDPATFG